MKKKSMEELGRLSPGDSLSSKKLPVSVILDNVRSAYNVGSCFRTADAFGLESIWLGGITACPPHREIMKTALGSTESVRWVYQENTLDAINKQKSDEKLVFAVEQVHHSTPLHEFIPEKGKAYSFVFGNEAFGVEDKVLSECHGSIEIPQFGHKHSLNIAISMGIALWHFFLHFSGQE